MATSLKQISMGITPNYAPKKTVGEGLANLILTSADAAIKYDKVQQQEKNRREVEEKEQDARDANFIKSKIYQAHTDGKFKSYKEAEDYINNTLKQDPDYVERFGENRDIANIWRNKDSHDAWRYSSSKLVKEMGKSDEQLKLEQIRRDESDDSIIYESFATNTAQKRAEADFDNMDFSGKKEYIENELTELQASGITEQFKSDKYKNAFTLKMATLQKSYDDVSYAVDEEVVNNKFNDLIGSYIANPQDIDATIEDQVFGMNDLLRPSKQLNMRDVQDKIGSAVYAHLVANKENYYTMSSSDIKKKFPVLGRVKNFETKEKISNILNEISFEKQKRDNAGLILIGEKDYTTGTTEEKNMAISTLDEVLVDAVEKNNKANIQSVTAFSIKNNIKLDYVETQAKSFNMLIDTEQTDAATEQGFNAYKNIKTLQSYKYVVRDDDAVKNISALEAVAKSSGFDINTQEGFRNAVIKRNIERQTKKARANRGKIYKYLDEETSLNPSQKISISDAAKSYMDSGVYDMEEAIEYAIEDNNNMYKDTDGQNLRDIGVKTAQDYKKLKDILKAERGTDVEEIMIFGSSVMVMYDSDRNDFKSELFSRKDLISKMKQ